MNILKYIKIRFFGNSTLTRRFKNCGLRNIILDGEFLYKVNFKGRNLTRSSLVKADLRKANLQGANLFNADLTDADLTNANLQGANLFNADLTDANLTNANLKDVKLWKTVGNSREIKNLKGYDYKIAYTKDIVFIGCEGHTFKEWEKFTDDEIRPMDSCYMRSEEFWAKYKDEILTKIKADPTE